MLTNAVENKTLLFESVRSVFPHLKSFSDDQIERKLEVKKLDDVITDFISYIQRERIMMRNEKLVEGVNLLKLVMCQMHSFQYPPQAITPKNVLGNLSMLDDYFYKEAYKKQKHLENAFPGYSHLMAGYVA